MALQTYPNSTLGNNPSSVALTMREGSNLNINTALIDVSGTAVNLTGYTIWFGYSYYRGATRIKTKSSHAGSGISLLDMAGGTFQISLNPVDTTGYKGDFFYETKVISSSNVEDIIMAGRLTILPSITYDL